METTKTSVKIAKALRKAGFVWQVITQAENGRFEVLVERKEGNRAAGCYQSLWLTTITAAYREVWWQYKEQVE